MLLDVYTKNFALVARHELDNQHVPRTGEIIVVNEEEHLVHNVEHKVVGNRLETLVSCHRSSGPMNRRIVLQENGWL
ncbi:hypothetical protein JF535_13295 [Microbulbifer salipaludis]|uniref:Uncharacterized protein n=1 Tax=Microbulbifer salipaludis TaxID=187980 RepID=A0ABS3E935_9GAMM|nr:hypothetical protein [Microbulbifer salipaludis]MBN8431827.1 hypothetical protein [Microbulbifer salipaludis]